jgi:hypothetical protein
MQRRHFIMGASSLAVVTISSVSYCAVAKTPQRAYLPWNPSPTPLADVRLDAFRYAILAPNPHNLQSWLIELRGEDEALIFCDMEKRLPVTDPFDRQITIGFGAFIELAAIAASRRGFGVNVESFPDGQPGEQLDKRPVARLTFKKTEGLIADPLADHILRRRSNKQLYDMERAIDAGALAKLAELGQATADAAILAKAKPIILGAVETESRTPLAHKESVDLMRIGKDAVDASPDGIALVGSKIETARALGFISAKSMLRPDSGAFKAGLEQTLEIHASIPGLFWITTPGDSRAEQLEAGRRYMRANLLATSLGIAMHPMSQSLQEYRELELANRNIHFLLADGECEAGCGKRIQMLARIGHAKSEIPPAPRWPMEKHLI